MMNQRRIFGIIAILVPVGLVATAVWSLGNKTSVKPLKKVKPKTSKTINKNEWLRGDFEKITNFYRSPVLHYKASYAYYSSGTETADNITNAELWMNNGNYLYMSDNNLIMRNASVSLMFDHASKVILIDSAFDVEAFKPGGLDLDTALTMFDSIKRTESPLYFEYHIPGRGLGVHHTVMQVRKTDMAITRMTIFVNSDANPDMVIKKMEIVFSAISTSPRMDDRYFETSNYVNKKDDSYTPVSKYGTYKIITKQTLQ